MLLQDAQLNQVLATANLDPTAVKEVTQKVEDEIEKKNKQIKDLSFELARLTKVLIAIGIGFN